MTSDDELELEGDKKSFEKKLDYELMIEKTMASWSYYYYIIALPHA